MQSDLQQRCNEAFGIGPSRFPLFPFRSHQQVLDGLSHGISQGRRLLCLTGAPGSGKSAVLAALYDSLPLGYVGLVNQPGLGDVWAGLRGQLRLTGDNCTPVSRDNLLAALLEAQTHELPIVQLIDNADKLRPEDFVQLNRFFDRCNGQIVLAGSEELHALFPGADTPSGRERSGQVFTLLPLSDAETEDYIAHRLKQARFDPDLFSADALAAVAEYSSGTPLLINMLCFMALAESCAADMRPVTASDIDAVASQRWQSGIYPFRVPPPGAKDNDNPTNRDPRATKVPDVTPPDRAAEGRGGILRAADKAASVVADASPRPPDVDRSRHAPPAVGETALPDSASTHGDATANDTPPLAVDPPPAPTDRDPANTATVAAFPTATASHQPAQNDRAGKAQRPPRLSAEPRMPHPGTLAAAPRRRRLWPTVAVGATLATAAALAVLVALTGQPDGQIDDLRGAFADKLYQLAAAIDGSAPSPEPAVPAAVPDTGTQPSAIANTPSIARADGQNASGPPSTPEMIGPPIALAHDLDIARDLPSPAAGPRPGPVTTDPQPREAITQDDRAAASPAAPRDATAVSPASDKASATEATTASEATTARPPLADARAPAIPPGSAEPDAATTPAQPVKPAKPPVSEPVASSTESPAKPALSPTQRSHIAELYRKRAEYEINKGEYAHALTSIQYGLETAPNHPALEHLRMVVLNELGKSERGQ